MKGPAGFAAGMLACLGRYDKGHVDGWNEAKADPHRHLGEELR